MNSSFSQKLPSFQLAWDSTSLGELKRCPRAYQLAIVEGWRSQEENVHLMFGIALHEGREWYARRRAVGESHDMAVESVVDMILRKTWDNELSRPAFVGDEKKNRFTLIRALVWLLDHWENDPLETLLFDDGRPMVEVSFRFPWGESASGEQLLLCGHLDRVGEINGQTWIADTKTTYKSLDEGSSQYFFWQFSPDNQVSLYTFAGQVVLAKQCAGVLIDAVQIAVGFSRFVRAPITRTKAQIAEWLEGTRIAFRQAEEYALCAFWPMNEKACFSCAFRKVCSLPPAARQAELEKNYMRRVWDPLQIRGE